MKSTDNKQQSTIQKQPLWQKILACAVLVTLLSALQPSVPASAQASTVATVDLSTPGVPISNLLYGVNNNWGELNGHGVYRSNFNSFYNALNGLGMTAFRYPGGWESEWIDWETNKYQWIWRGAGARGTAQWLKSRRTRLNGPESSLVTQKISSDNSTEGLYVVPVQKYLCHPVSWKLNALVDEVTDIVRDNRNVIDRWEIGNEWFYVGDCNINQARGRENYATAAIALTNAILSVDPGADVYVTGRWYLNEGTVSDFQRIKARFGRNWSKLAGITTHVYTGHAPTKKTIGSDPKPLGVPGSSQLANRMAALKSFVGSSMEVHVTEWASSTDHNVAQPNRSSKQIAAANHSVEMMYAMQQAGIDGAFYWSAVDYVPFSLMEENPYRPTAVGTAFEWMQESLIGESLRVQTQVSGPSSDVVTVAASRNGNQLTLFIMGKELPRNRDVSVKISGVASNVDYQLVSAEVLHRTGTRVPGVTLRQGSRHTDVQLRMNTSSEYEIARITLVAR